jgi:hypothetical protein
LTRIRTLVAASLLGVTLLAAACDGEDRPQVDVIGQSSGSVSASGVAPPQVGGSPSTNYYVTVSNVDTYFQIGLDLRDIRAIMAPAANRQPVDWAAALALYENGKNQVSASGAVRPLASLPNEDVQAVFPNGASVYGRSNFIDAIIRDGLTGSGEGAGLSDNSRRQLVDKGIQMLIYGKALQELEAAKTRVSQNNTDNATGAPHAVDEAWASVAGPPDFNSNRSYSLLATAAGREENFDLSGRLRQPLELAFVGALEASQRANQAGFDRLHGEIKGYLNAIFYLGALRYVKTLEADTTAADRETHLIEGWTFWQTIRATVASASPSAAQAVEAAYNRSPNDAFPSSVTTEVYAALNELPVLQALGIPVALQVRTPPQ